jgi:hypothetical protein
MQEVAIHFSFIGAAALWGTGDEEWARRPRTWPAPIAAPATADSLMNALLFNFSLFGLRDASSLFIGYPSEIPRF